jgi:dolichol-phosphate mannosyltransferase
MLKHNYENNSIELSTLYIVTPVYNEANNLDRLVSSFRAMQKDFEAEYCVKFIMVDDGSTDDTGQLAQRLASNIDFVLLSHSVNIGPGKAFATAFQYLAPKLREKDWLVTMEGDNTSRLEILQQMLTRTAEGYEVILASPFMYSGGILQTTFIRVFLSFIANNLFKGTLGIQGILTVSSFYRLYQGSALLKLQSCYGEEIIERKGFESMVELLMKLIFLEVSISEVPMVLNSDLRKGKSKMKKLPTIMGYFTLLKKKKHWQKTAHDMLGI